ncbi:MAG: hypothetical protein AAF611_20670 [Bacteroidota bacterium]
MRKYFLLIVTVIAFVSCSNDDDANTTIPTSTRILGNWNWISSVGGEDAVFLTPNIAGYTQRLEFTADTVSYYFNEELMTETPYTIEVQDSNIYDGTYEMLLTEFEARNIIEFDDNGTLILIGDCADCWTTAYVKELE